MDRRRARAGRRKRQEGVAMRIKRIRRTGETLTWGLVLIGFGVCFLFINTGAAPNDLLRHWWPAIIIIAGLGSIFGARVPKEVGGAVTTSGIGMWLLIANNDWYGLGWSRSWPLSFVAIGLGTLTEAIVARFWRESEEEIHVS